MHSCIAIRSIYIWWLLFLSFPYLKRNYCLIHPSIFYRILHPNTWINSRSFYCHCDQCFRFLRNFFIPIFRVCAPHPVWYSRVHSYGLFTLLFNHQVHVVVLQDGDHLYLHGTPQTHAQQSAQHFRKSLISRHYVPISTPVILLLLFLFCA